MKIIENIYDNINIDIKNPVVTIGNFDGVHRGHRLLIERVVSESKTCDGTPVVITFYPHPLTVVNPYMQIEQITPLRDKLDLLGQAGIEIAIVLKFDDDFSRLQPREFLMHLLVGRIGVREVVVGYDFAFGRDKAGTIGLLETVGREAGFRVSVVDPLVDHERIVSSSRIRSFIKDGNIREANNFLGRPYRVKGTVVHGKQIGHAIGFPTANLEVHNYMMPRKGVYSAYVKYGDRRGKAVLSIGPAPTFHQDAFAFEVHIIDFDGDVYGCEIEVELIDRIRGIEKFADVEDLKAQIRADIDKAKRMLP